MQDDLGFQQLDGYKIIEEFDIKAQYLNPVVTFDAHNKFNQKCAESINQLEALQSKGLSINDSKFNRFTNMAESFLRESSLVTNPSHVGLPSGKRKMSYGECE